jgi:hypothetical protein
MSKGLNLLWSTILAVTMVSFFFSITLVAQAADLSVETSAICKDVVDREPVDEGNSSGVFTVQRFSRPMKSVHGVWK